MFLFNHKYFLRIIWVLIAFYFIGLHIGFVTLLLYMFKLGIPFAFIITLIKLSVGVIRDVDFCYFDYFNLKVLGFSLFIALDALLFIILFALLWIADSREHGWRIVLSITILRGVLWLAFRNDHSITPKHNI